MATTMIAAAIHNSLDDVFGCDVGVGVTAGCVGAGVGVGKIPGIVAVGVGVGCAVGVGVGFVAILERTTVAGAPEPEASTYPGA